MLFRHFYPHQLGFNSSSKSRPVAFLPHFPPGALSSPFSKPIAPPWTTGVPGAMGQKRRNPIQRVGCPLVPGHNQSLSMTLKSIAPDIPQFLLESFQVHQSDFLIDFLKIFSISFYRHLEFMLLTDNVKKAKLNKSISN